MIDRRHTIIASVCGLTIAQVSCGQEPARRIEPPRPGVVDPIPEDEAALVQMMQDIGVSPEAEALLDELESADESIRTFQAEVRWDRRFVLQGDRHVRFGELFFKVDPTEAGGIPRRTFAVRFDELLIDDILRPEQRQWVFDGQWLYEKDFKERTFIARRLAREGERIDPLRLGEGPIPLPIGQKKADILSRYGAELLPPDAGLEADASMDAQEMEELAGLRRFVEETRQLRLVPRKWYRDESEFREIRLWYQHGSLHPRMARTVNRAGDDSIVQLINIITNQPLPPGSIEIERPREEDGWRVEIDPGRFGTNDQAEEERP